MRETLVQAQRHGGVIGVSGRGKVVDGSEQRRHPAACLGSRSVIGQRGRGVVYRLNHQDSRAAIPHIPGLENHAPRQLTLDAQIVHLREIRPGIGIAGGDHRGDRSGFQRTVRHQRRGNKQSRIDVVSGEIVLDAGRRIERRHKVYHVREPIEHSIADPQNRLVAQLVSNANAWGKVEIRVSEHIVGEFGAPSHR